MPRINFLTRNTDRFLAPANSTNVYHLHTVSKTPHLTGLDATGAVTPMFSQALSDTDHVALHKKAENMAYVQLSHAGSGQNLIRGESLHGVPESNKLRTLDGSRFELVKRGFNDSIPSMLPTKTTIKPSQQMMDYVSYRPSAQVHSTYV